MNRPDPSSHGCSPWNADGRDRGFTLIEVLVTLTITSMILFFVLMAVGAAQNQSRQTQQRLMVDNRAQKTFAVLSRDLQNMVIPSHAPIEWFRLHWVPKAQPGASTEAMQWITFLSQTQMQSAGRPSLLSYRHGRAKATSRQEIDERPGLFRAELSPHLTLRDQVRSAASSYWRKHPNESLAPRALLMGDVDAFYLSIHYKDAHGLLRQVPLTTRVRFKGRLVETRPRESALVRVDQITAMEMHLSLVAKGNRGEETRTYSRQLALPWSTR